MRTVLLRGLRRRCPHCGNGALFRRWITAFDRCSACGYRFQRNYGDTWFFWILTDRIPLFIAIVAIYWGFVPRGALASVAGFLAIALPLIVTMPQRQGLGIALDYLSRVHMRDPSDEFP